MIRFARNKRRYLVDPTVTLSDGRTVTQPVNWASHILQEPDRAARAITVEEQESLLAIADELPRTHLGGVLRVGIWTGMRRANILSLNWQQIDLAACTITIKRKSRKPGGKVQVLRIPRPMLIWLANRAPKTGPVFPSELDPAKAITTVKTAWHTARKAAALPDLRFHEATRKTHGTRVAAAAGNNPRVAQMALGHSDLKTTMHYLQLMDHETVEAVERAALISEKSNSQKTNEEQSSTEFEKLLSPQTD